MQKKAWILSCYTVVCAAVAIFLRWVQVMRSYDPETGLYLRGTVSDWIMAIACVVYGLALLIQVRMYCSKPGRGSALPPLRTKNLFFFVAAMVSAVLMLAGGVAMFIGAADIYPVSLARLIRILAVFSVLTGLAIPGMASGTNVEKPSPLHCLCAVVPVLFCCYWLIVEYKIYAQDPEVWRYAFDILAVAASALAFYFIAGFFLGRPKPRGAAFFSQLGAFFCFVAVMDDSEAWHVLVLCAAALLLLLFSWLIVRNSGEQV